MFQGEELIKMPVRPGSIVMICGYRGHGKNTFAEWLQGKNDFTYHIYGPNTEEDIRNYLHQVPQVLTDKESFTYNEISFARCLKEKAAAILKLTVAELEEIKDKPLVNNPYQFQLIKPSAVPVARDILIDIAAVKRAKNIDYFTQYAAHHYYDPNKINLITDFRYLNEFNCWKELFPQVDIITVRVHRPLAAIPDQAVKSEHDLDYFVPDFLVTNNHMEDSITHYYGGYVGSDIKLVISQTGASWDQTIKAMNENNGDIIGSIMEIVDLLRKSTL